MQYEKSCGFVPYTERGGERLYLIIQSTNGDFGFPKGHTENGESEHETAIRELKEEVGIEAEIIHDFRRQIEYPLRSKKGVVKRSVYFLGKCKTTCVVPEDGEVKSAVFLPFSDALKLLTFDDTKDILREADNHLKSLGVNGKCEHI